MVNLCAVYIKPAGLARFAPQHWVFLLILMQDRARVQPVPAHGPAVQKGLDVRSQSVGAAGPDFDLGGGRVHADAGC